MTTVAAAMMAKEMVNSRLTNSWPPSSWVAALVICGTSTALSTPPASSR